MPIQLRYTRKHGAADFHAEVTNLADTIVRPELEADGAYELADLGGSSLLQAAREERGRAVAAEQGAKECTLDVQKLFPHANQALSSINPFIKDPNMSLVSTVSTM